MRRINAVVMVFALVLAGCSSPIDPTGEDFSRGIEVAVVDEDDVPENATVVDASRIEPSRNDLDELFDEAIREQGSVSQNYNRSTFEDIKEQLSAAPEHENDHYVRYEGEIIRIAMFVLH